MKQENAMTTKAVHFTPGRVYCVTALGDAEDAAPLLLKYHGPEQPWEDICSGESTRLDPEVIEDTFEVPPDIVAAIARAHRAARPSEAASERRAELDDAPETWERDIYWDD
ncbi:MAG TPA: hypothetical protein PLR66_00800 [Planctomycetota bacterium]|jgi:hypothetical protein|nr:hypothetical protein [Planctomycetota bacterium]